MASRNTISRWSGIGSVVVAPLVVAAFYGVLVMSPTPFLHRYFMGHPVSIVATVLFGIAIVGLGLRWIEARSELRTISDLADNELKPHSIDSNSVSVTAERWINHLEGLPSGERASHFVGRIEEIVQRQLRRGTARFLNDDLREVAERDSEESHDSLQLVRIIVWAIPMLGFLGTVIGITQTLGGLDFTDAQNAVDKLKAGLYVAFDTTALGLVLSVVAIFLQLPVEKKLSELLARLDDRTSDVFFGAFPDETPSDEPLAAIAEMNRAVLASVNELVATQADLWKTTVDSAHEHWASVVGSAGDQVQSALTEAIDHSLVKVQQTAAAQADQRWQQWQTTLSENARVLLAQQQALTEQNELLAASGNRAEELSELRGLFEDNLRGLTTFPDMSDAMRSLARAIDMLNARVSDQAQQGRAA